MSHQPTNAHIQPNLETEFDAACIDVLHSRVRRPLSPASNHDLFPRFAQQYERLLVLPRRARRTLQRQWKRTLGSVALLLALTPGAAFAATMNVAAGVAPDVKVDGKCSLIEAIVNANNDAKTQPDCPAGIGTDTIDLPTNSKQTLTRSFTTVTLPPYSNTYKVGLPQIKSPIVIEGRGSTIELADQAPINSVVYVAGTGNLTLNETTVSGHPPAASVNYLYDVSNGVRNDGTLLMVKGSLVRNKLGLWNGGKATLRQTNVSDNHGYYYALVGGGIENRGTLTLTSSTVSGNYGFDVGGISNRGTAVIDNSAITGNRDGYQGGSAGGVHNVGTLTLNNSIISANHSYGCGALRNSGTANVVRTTISGNVTEPYGSSSSHATVSSERGSLTLTNSTISGNSTGGDTIHVGGGAVTLTHSTLTANVSTYYGSTGGIYVYDGAVTLQHSIVAGNVYDRQSEIDVRTGYGSVVANNFNLFGYAGKSGVTGFTPGPTDIVPSQPLSGILMPLASNGGTNKTHALAINSPALNAAPVDATCKSVDQRGNPRPQGVKCDIGAFEGSAVLCNGLVTTQVGTALADTLTGTNGVDVIAGLNGNDTLRGLNGNDVICAGSGSDTAYGGNGNDQLFGDADSDKLYGDAGNDALSGGAGTDICNGGTNTAAGDSATQCETVVGVP